MPPKKTNEPLAAGKGKEKAKLTERKGLRVVYHLQDLRQSDKTWNLIGLPVIGTLLLALAITLIAIGAKYDIEDLIILGSLFLFGSGIFYVIMYFTVCRPMCQRNVIETYEFADDLKKPVLNSQNQRQKSQETDYGSYYNDTFEMAEDFGSGKHRPQPTESQLYGDRMRQFLATPATTKDVKFYDDDDDEPPPPRLALPSDPGDTKNPVFTMDVDQEMAKHTSREMSNLELL